MAWNGLMEYFKFVRDEWLLISFVVVLVWYEGKITCFGGVVTAMDILKQIFYIRIDVETWTEIFLVSLSGQTLNYNKRFVATCLQLH